MHADAETHQVANEDEPTVGIFFVGYGFPFEDAPEYNGCE